MSEAEDIGGRLAANFRMANIAEGIAAQMLRPIAAIAPVPREEDHGIDLIATLLRREGRCFVAKDSIVIQVKTHTAARFAFKGDGIRWLRQLRLPYFPMVADLTTASVSLFTLNRWHHVIHAGLVDKYVFVMDDDMENDPGDEFFALGDPLMRWSFADCIDPDFPNWAYSVLKPAIHIETMNQQYGPMWRFIELVGNSYSFAKRDAKGRAVDPPRAGSVLELPPGDLDAILGGLRCVIGPFANLVSNTLYPEDRSGDFLQLRDSFRRLGFEPDPLGRWDAIAQEMAEDAKKISG